MIAACLKFCTFPEPSIFVSLRRKEKFQCSGFGHKPLKKFSPRDVILMASRHPCEGPPKAPSVEKLGAGLFQVCVCWRPWRCCRFSFSSKLRPPEAKSVLRKLARACFGEAHSWEELSSQSTQLLSGAWWRSDSPPPLCLR